MSPSSEPHTQGPEWVVLSNSVGFTVAGAGGVGEAEIKYPSRVLVQTARPPAHTGEIRHQLFSPSPRKWEETCTHYTLTWTSA